MVFEDNGNLLLYQNDDSVVWSTESQWRHAETFHFADDGKFFTIKREIQFGTQNLMRRSLSTLVIKLLKLELLH